MNLDVRPMTHDTMPIDASAMPELSRLVREVARTGKPCLIHADGVSAVHTPAPKQRKAAAMKDQEFRAGLHATFGSLRGGGSPAS